MTRTQRFVMQMSSRENPSLPCDAEKVGLDFNEIVREIVEEQEDIKKYIYINEF